MTATIKEFSDAQLFDMFNIDCGEFLVPQSLRCGLAYGEGYRHELDGQDMWEVKVVKPKKETLSRADIARLQAAERAERVRMMAANLENCEANDLSLADSLPKPQHADK